MTEDQRAIIDSFHSKGHFGINATLSQQKVHNHKWKYIHEHVMFVVANCTTCQKWNQAKRVYTALRSIDSKLPWQHIQVDLITSFPSTSRGNKYILCMVDIFSSLVISSALKSKEADEVAHAMWSIFGIVGVPNLIQSDNGGEFKNAIIERLAKIAKTALKNAVPFHHEAMGKVENKIKTYSNVLHKLLDERGGEWDVHIPSATLYTNAKISADTGLVPFLLFFNRPTNLFDTQLKIPSPEDLQSTSEDEIIAWRKHQKDIMDVFYPNAFDLIAAKKARRAAAFNKKHHVNLDAVPIPLGSTVNLYDPVRASKMEPPFYGPFIIASYLDGRYEIKDLAGAMYHRPVVRSELKYHPLAVAQMGSESYVEKIIEHRPDVEEDSFQYKVLFAGHPDPNGTWVKAKYIDSNAIRDYTNSLKRILVRPSVKAKKKAQMDVDDVKSVPDSEVKSRKKFHPNVRKSKRKLSMEPLIYQKVYDPKNTTKRRRK
jgi:hypothetical protein